MLKVFVRRFRTQLFVNIFENKKLVLRLTWNKEDWVEDTIYSDLLIKLGDYYDIKYIVSKIFREALNSRAEGSR